MTSPFDGKVAAAFPLAFEVANSDGSKSTVYQMGMTLRDYFAAKAMQASIAKDGMPRGDTKEFLADQSYEMADAMLKARQQ